MPLDVISVQGSPVLLLKFQMAPSVKVKNDWKYTSTPFLCLRGVDRNMFFFFLLSPITEIKGLNKCIFFTNGSNVFIWPLLRGKCVPSG